MNLNISDFRTPPHPLEIKFPSEIFSSTKNKFYIIFFNGPTKLIQKNVVAHDIKSPPQISLS